MPAGDAARRGRPALDAPLGARRRRRPRAGRLAPARAAGASRRRLRRARRALATDGATRARTRPRVAAARHRHRSHRAQSRGGPAADRRGEPHRRRATCSRTDSGSSTSTEPPSAPSSFVQARPASEWTCRGKGSASLSTRAMPAAVLVWAERLRANTLRLPLVRPPADTKLRALQAELRRVAARLREAESNGRPAPGAAARQTRLGAGDPARTRLVRGEVREASATPLSAVARTLGHRALVEYVELDGAMRAVSPHGRAAHAPRARAGRVGPELEWLRFALTRLARGTLNAAQRIAALEGARSSAAALDRLLVEPLLPVLGDAPLVLAPTGPLHALPWGALPSLRGRPVAVDAVARGLARLAGPHTRASEDRGGGGPATAARRG